ncbi:MAG: hypothetical protein MI919_25130, partial [Holophagales bacterium]|nr:hypothetical protein [Holophagales bacterium]
MRTFELVVPRSLRPWLSLPMFHFELRRLRAWGLVWISLVCFSTWLSLAGLRVEHDPFLFFSGVLLTFAALAGVGSMLIESRRDRRHGFFKARPLEPGQLWNSRWAALLVLLLLPVLTAHGWILSFHELDAVSWATAMLRGAAGWLAVLLAAGALARVHPSMSSYLFTAVVLLWALSWWAVLMGSWGFPMLTAFALGMVWVHRMLNRRQDRVPQPVLSFVMITCLAALVTSAWQPARHPGPRAVPASIEILPRVQEPEEPEAPAAICTSVLTPRRASNEGYSLELSTIQILDALDGRALFSATGNWKVVPAEVHSTAVPRLDQPADRMLLGLRGPSLGDSEERLLSSVAGSVRIRAEGAWRLQRRLATVRLAGQKKPRTARISIERIY